MPLSAGAKLGPYEIVLPLGAGGMGEVYQARDSRLNRMVALKILPAGRMSDPERRGRFVQEAQLASSLQHPNIVTIYDIGAADGVDYIAMELVRGKSLEALIPRHGLRLHESLKLAAQVCDALAAAHEAGVVHRDLKPGNIMVTEAGVVKVVDFGLAKLAETGVSSEADATRTQSPVRTQEGTILGSAPYMSPEQAEGKPVDARSDIFSFGAILYEMLSGRRAFPGDTRMSTLAAVLRSEPKPLPEVVEGLPRDVERLVSRCLRKDLSQRAQHMADLKLALEELREESQSGLPAAASAKKRGWALPVVGALLVALLAVGAWWLWRDDRSGPSYEPLPLTTYAGAESNPTFSPDGNQVAFQWSGEQNQQPDIYVKLVGGSTPLRLTTDPGAHRYPAWSPDGKSIAYWANHPAGTHGVFLISALGGQERLISETRSARSVAWSPDSKWVAFAGINNDRTGITFLQVETGETRDLAKLNPALAGASQPAFSPDGRHLAYVQANADVTFFAIYVIGVGADMKPVGQPVHVSPAGASLARYPVWTADGSEIVFMDGAPNSRGAISRVKPDGKAHVRPIPGLGYSTGPLAISRNGRLAFSRGGIDSDIWRYDLKGGEPPRKLIASTVWDSGGEYSPDGKRIAFVSNRSGAQEIWVCDAEGGNAEQVTHIGGPFIVGTARWSPDGRRIAFDARPSGVSNVFVANADGGGMRQLTQQTAGNTGRPAWSPDGKWIYYSSERNGSQQIWRMTADGSQDGTQSTAITKRGGFTLRVSAEGEWLYYVPTLTGPVWKIHPDGTEDSLVWDDKVSSLGFAVTAEGIYGFGPPPAGSVQLLRFADGKAVEVLNDPAIGNVSNLGLSLTPDRRYMLLTKPDGRGTDLMLVEGFR